MSNNSAHESSKFLRFHDLNNLEVLQATYITHSFALHTHESFALGLIEKGAEALYCRGSSYTVPAGHIVAINPGDVHGGQAATKTGYSYRMLYPSTAVLQQMAREITEHRQDMPFFRSPIIEDKQLAHLVRHFHAALEEPLARLEQETLFQDTLTQLILRHATVRPALHVVGKEPQAIRLIREYIEANASENISLDQLSHVANLSPFYLMRAFRRTLGMSPHTYLIHVRVKHAKALLAQHHPLLHVALETGFADQSHFTKHFKRLVGVTPGQYAQHP